MRGEKRRRVRVYVFAVVGPNQSLGLSGSLNLDADFIELVGVAGFDVLHGSDAGVCLVDCLPWCGCEICCGI